MLSCTQLRQWVSSFPVAIPHSRSFAPIRATCVQLALCRLFRAIVPPTQFWKTFLWSRSLAIHSLIHIFFRPNRPKNASKIFEGEGKAHVKTKLIKLSLLSRALLCDSSSRSRHAPHLGDRMEPPYLCGIPAKNAPLHGFPYGFTRSRNVTYCHLLLPLANCCCYICCWHDDKTHHGHVSETRKFAN